MNQVSTDTTSDPPRRSIKTRFLVRMVVEGGGEEDFTDIGGKGFLIRPENGRGGRGGGTPVGLYHKIPRSPVGVM